MRELIKITENAGNNAVSARDLHQWLETEDHFTQWAKRMFEYGFSEGTDYQAVHEFVAAKNGFGGKNKIDYVLTLDAAKEISMIQRTEKGKEARQYFIEVEKRLRKSVPVVSTLDMLKIAVQELEQKDKQIKLLQPKADFLDKVLDTDEKIDIGQAAKILKLPFGRNTMFSQLKARGVFFKNRNEPKQEYISKQYFELKEKYISRNEHDGFMVLKVLVTQKGLRFLSDLFDGDKTNNNRACLN